METVQPTRIQLLFMRLRGWMHYRLIDWHCRIVHWRYRHIVFGGYPFGGRTNRPTGIHCDKCHTTRAVRDWRKAVVVKSDKQIMDERAQYGIEQFTPEECWRNGKWKPKKNMTSTT
jgi:hypothetical protein